MHAVQHVCGLLCHTRPMHLTAELHGVTPAQAAQVEYFVSSNFGEQMYNSCKVQTVSVGLECTRVA